MRTVTRWTFASSIRNNWLRRLIMLAFVLPMVFLNILLALWPLLLRILVTPFAIYRTNIEVFRSLGVRWKQPYTGPRGPRGFITETLEENMSMKGKPGKFDCLKKIKRGEPFFVLRAQDKLAPKRVRDWAAAASMAGVNGAKVEEALAVAKSMEEYQKHMGSKLPD